jgi:hypothetical protein
MNWADALMKNPEAALQFLRRFLNSAADRTAPEYQQIARWVTAQDDLLAKETKDNRP